MAVMSLILRALPLPLLTLSLLTACVDDPSPSNEAGGTGSGTEGGTDTTMGSADETGETETETETGEEAWECIPVGLASMREFALPAGIGSMPTLSQRNPCDDVDMRAEARDLNGDGIMDLAVTDDCDPDTPPDTWTVYPGTPAGFADEPLAWGMPDDYGEPGRYSTLGCAGCNHQVLDMDADGQPDMLVAYVLGQLGTWRVHRGTATGFDPQGEQYSTPPGDMQFWGTAEDDCSVPPPTQSDQWFPEYFLADFDGDRQPDLVVDPQCDDTSLLEESEVSLYFGGTSGFDSSPTAWAMPGVLPTECEAGAPTGAGLFDIDGDDALEFVETDGCRDLCEASSWLVYEPQGDGYTAAPRAYDVPGSVACSGHPTDTSPGTQWIDVTLDGVPDVVRAEEDGQWVIYRGGDQGLEEIGRVDLPSIAGEPLTATRGTGEIAYGVVQLDRALPPALVVTTRPDDAGVGTTHWEVYEVECAQE